MKIFVQCKHFKDGEHLSTSCGFYDSLNMTFEDKLCLKDYEVIVKDDTTVVKDDTTVVKGDTTSGNDCDVGEKWLLTIIPNNEILKLFGIIDDEKVEQEIKDTVEYESDDCTDDGYDF
jgi:hypothetical protein